MITEKLDRIPFTSHFKWYLPLQTNDIFYFMINLRYSSVNVFILIEHQCLTEDEKGEIDLYCPVYDFFYYNISMVIALTNYPLNKTM